MIKKKKIKCYEVNTKDSEVFAISLVTDAAIDKDFVYLSKDKPMEIYLDSDEKKIIVGGVLVPDYPIYRNQGGEEFYLQFSKESIEYLSHKYLINLYNHNVTTQHDEEVKDISVIESWIVEDEHDKINRYGLDLPIGSWVVMMKVNNDDVWSQIKSGELKGYSIESFISIDEINNLNNNIEMNKVIKQEAVEITDGFWDKLRGIISDALGKPQESTEVESTVGEIMDEIEKEAPKEEEPKVIEQVDEVIPKVEEMVQDIVTDVNENAETEEVATNELQAIIDGLTEEIKLKDGEIEMLKKKNCKLSKQPSTNPIKLSVTKDNKVSFLDSYQEYMINR